MTVPDDSFIVEIGGERFDPKTRASVARRRANAGRKKLAQALGVAVEELPGIDREVYLVQFVKELDGVTVSRFREDYGLKLTMGPGGVTFIERMDKETTNRVRRDATVRACISYESNLKLTKSVSSAVGKTVNIVLFKDIDEGLIDALRGLGATNIVVNDDRDLGGVVTISFKATLGVDLTLVAALPAIIWVELESVIVSENNVTAAVHQSGDPSKHPIWQKGLDGKNMIVGVIDIGIPDMQSLYFSHTVRSIGANHRKVVQIRMLAEDVADAHATGMVGCIAGDLPKPDSGKDPNRGGAWAARITYTSKAKYDASTPLKIFGAAASEDARIHSCSWRDVISLDDLLSPTGNPSFSLNSSYSQRSIDLDSFLFHNSEQIVIVANPSQGNPTGISVSKNNVVVTACTKQLPHNNAGIGVTNFTRDDRRKPDLMAVGTEVETATLTDTDFGNIPTEVESVSGTSPATAHVAAAAALIRQYFTEGFYPSGKKQQQDQRKPSGALIKAMLLNATVSAEGIQAYPTAEDGWGRLKLDETLHFEGDKLFLMVQDVPHIFGLKEDHPQLYTHLRLRYKTYPFKVRKNAKSMKITLVFNDPPGPIGQTNLAVNKLDIQVTEPDGKDRKTYVGNDFIEIELKSREHNSIGNLTNIPPDEQELKNNVRQVLVRSPKAGRWTTSVIAHKFDPGRTPFPLEYVSIPGAGTAGQGYSLVVRVEYG